MPAKQNTRKLTNYLIFMIKIKYKESKIVKKCLGWINLLVVSRGKCNMALKGKFYLSSGKELHFSTLNRTCFVNKQIHIFSCT